MLYVRMLYVICYILDIFGFFNFLYVIFSDFLIFYMLYFGFCMLDSHRIFFTKVLQNGNT